MIIEDQNIPKMNVNRASWSTRLLENITGLFRSSSEGHSTEYAYLQLGDPEHFSDFPTEEERLKLRRVADAIPWSAYLVAFVELAERFSYYGTTVVFTNFIQQPLPPHSRTGAGYADGQSGALGLGQRASTAIGTFNSFWVYIIPLLGAYIADTRWGRFKTICISVGIALIGHVILVGSALPGPIEHQKLSLSIFLTAVVIMGIGTGGFKANISPLVAEQYRRTKLSVTTLQTGERVIIDPALTTARIYMYFYLFINTGALVGQIGMTYSEKYVGFWLAYSLPTLVFLLCPYILYLGRNRYIKTPPSESVLLTVFRMVKFQMNGRWSMNPFIIYERMQSPGFWTQARPSHVPPHNRPLWMTYSDGWVDEVRRGFKACEVFLWYPIYYLSLNQLNNNLTSQAATMRTDGVPNDVLSNLDPLTLVIFIPIFDFCLYPSLGYAGFRFTPLKRITAGFIMASIAMAWTASVQHSIYQRNPCGLYVATCEDADGRAVTSDLSVWLQAPSYILIGLSEILASITGLEYAYTKAPKNMRSLVMAVFLFMSAVASAIGEAFVSLSADPLLVWNYGVMSVLAAIAGTAFWFHFSHLDMQEDDLNNLSDESLLDIVLQE
ncbi:PTR2-domain-containing protein [Laetiporus sulphureus 93-53]|uniref:PTR2-domain-containing protein n=1 Tax=Laetiporus sulphureus 93-53 TaxID=1314785 RepID=A0A165CHB3_9APHY|nr:PTR2-domain-containing protein [Laetiporus sulphureus 93-53]KZT02811.1 PTR2-domain-containing protein [Laetiporus sulphureus 93-53]